MRCDAERTIEPRKANRMAELTHYRKTGEVAMVDVTAKAVTNRTAVARGFLRVSRAALRKLRRMQTPKGNPLEVARIAGIAAAKRTAEWIPLCHPLPLTHIDVTARVCQNGLEFTSRVTATARTGVEMEALTAVTAAALTAYDMLKALDKGMEITGIYLAEKRGGSSGDYVAPSARTRKQAGKRARTGRERRTK
ncbi:MAG: cyclic pyranopterin monophosphate synthase MoaC [Candidatus Acidiferrales bacterium]